MRPRGAMACLCLAMLGSCGKGSPPPDLSDGDTTAADGSAQFPSLPDSLVLTAPSGITVWFTGARRATDSSGAPCLERGLVIVRDGSRTLVPLLMTRAAPTLVNDSTMRAHLSSQCVPVDTYEVNLTTGQPTRTQ